MLEELDKLEENSVGSIVTDPPYEINFMGKDWDNAGVAFSAETWKKCLRVLKPGGYLLSFAAARTQHRIACAIEDAGFEIRDTIMWLYSSGFPKSMNISKQLDKSNLPDFSEKFKGFGTALKPAYEPIIVARKPVCGTVADNVMTYGVGGINIDECRVHAKHGEYDIRHYTNEDCFQNTKPKRSKFQVKPQPDGRFPSNVILTYDESDCGEVCGGFPDSGSGNGGAPYNYSGKEYHNKDTSMFNGDKPQAPSNYNDSGSASRYFYCAKASKRDRDEGLDDLETNPVFELVSGTTQEIQDEIKRLLNI